MSDANTWNEARVCEWLKDSKLGHLVPVFQKNSIDGATLMSLTKTDLREELKVEALKDRKELWAAIEDLQKSTARSGPAPVPTPAKSIEISVPTKAEVPPKVSPRYQSEYGQAYGKGDPPAVSPKRPTATRPTAVLDSDPRNCEYCYKPFAKGTDRIVLTLPGEDRGAHLHETCKDDWTKENAKACEHCGELMATGIVTVTLPGAKRGADLHVACKESWLVKNARQCDHCHEPMTTDLVTISGSFGEAAVHEKCCDAFEAELKRPKKTALPPSKPTVLSMSPKNSAGAGVTTSTGMSPKAGVKCAECGVKSAKEPMVSLTGPWGIATVHTKCADQYERKRTRAGYNAPGSGAGGRCEHCLKRFTPKDSPIMVTIPGTSRMVEMHPVCHSKWSKINAPKCENCGKPMVTEIITLSGAFGKAECHKECVNDYEKKIRVNGGRKP